VHHDPAIKPIDRVMEKGAHGWFQNNHPRTVLVYVWSLLPTAAKRPVVFRLEPGGRYHARDLALRHQLVWVSATEPGTP
jgi:hypothetical protein